MESVASTIVAGKTSHPLIPIHATQGENPKLPGMGV